MIRRLLPTAILALCVAFPAAASDIPDFIPTISVSGSATVTMSPDTASFSITSSFTKQTTEEARKSTTEMIGTAVEILTKEFAIPVEDIETSYISASPEYVWKDDERVLTGQKVSQSIDVKTHDLDSIGYIYTRLMSLDGITLSDVSLDKEDKSAEYREARMNAVRDAYDKASAYAGAAGIDVGNILSISDNQSYTAPLYRSANLMLAFADAAAFESSPTEFYSGDISVSANVSIVYAIAQ